MTQDDKKLKAIKFTNQPVNIQKAIKSGGLKVVSTPQQKQAKTATKKWNPPNMKGFKYGIGVGY